MCRVVAQQDLEARTLHAVLRPHKVAALGEWRLAVVLDPDNGDAVSPAADHDVVVQEQSPAHVALAADKLGKVGLARLLRRPVVITHIVMVAQDGDNAVTGMQPGEFGAERDEFFGVVVHQVAREGNQVGLLRVHSLDNAPHGLRMRGEGAYMQVAHLHDAIAVECRRQVGRGIRNLPHFEGIGAKCITIEHRPAQQQSHDKAETVGSPPHDRPPAGTPGQRNEREDRLGHRHGQQDDEVESFPENLRVAETFKQHEPQCGQGQQGVRRPKQPALQAVMEQLPVNIKRREHQQDHKQEGNAQNHKSSVEGE